MKSFLSIALVGNYPPRRCGIATFTHDLHCAVAMSKSDLKTNVVAMTDSGGTYAYPKAVVRQIRDEVIDDYHSAATFLNETKYDVVSLQHEYGIFGGEAGCYIVALLSRLEMPIITTLHTVLPQPTSPQFQVMQQIIDVSTKLVVMAEKGHELLRSVHGVPASKIEIIPHGIPDFPFIEAAHAKTKFGYGDRTVILTFGLLSPNKGIEMVIEAMPSILRSCPNAVYVVLGATHPNLVREQGEAYRDSLAARASDLGVEDQIVFLNQYVDQATLLDYISMCDVYVTPYLNEAQMTSGTLAYSFGLGKAVVSTPYWHAKELLAEGRGLLVPFGDSRAIGAEITALLNDNVRRDAMRRRAYATSRSMTWRQTAEQYLKLFKAAHTGNHCDRIGHRSDKRVQSLHSTMPEVRTEHLLSMCDSTGLLQHAVYGVPDRSHGYCIDDNARALLLSCTLAQSGEESLPEQLSTRFAAFIQHAWNADTGRFRNFMSYDRRWLEEQGSEDSHGRTLWALGVCARADIDPSRRNWAAALFRTALPVVERFSSPRAWAFTLLGLDAACGIAADDSVANRLRRLLADRLLAQLGQSRDDWFWFEDVLAYDNARLCQALIQTGLTTHNPYYVDAGLQALRWLMPHQTAPSGCFRPVGSNSFVNFRKPPEAFDQQAIEAAATIAACSAAARADASPEWSTDATRAFNWFMGANDLLTPLIDTHTGSCLDGLHKDRPNENKGAESVLSYLLGLVEIRQLLRVSEVVSVEPAGIACLRAEKRQVEPQKKSGARVVSISVLESSNTISPPRFGSGRGQTVQAGDRAAGPQSD